MKINGSSSRLGQCTKVEISTTKTITMKVDGEPIRLLPSVIDLEFDRAALMLKKRAVSIWLGK